MLTWLSDEEFVIDDFAFQITFPRPTNPTQIPEAFSDRTFSIAKPRWLLEQYLELMKTLRPRNVFELGIYRGGSTVVFAMLANPRKHVAIDLVDNTTETFGDWLRDGPLSPHVVAHFGVDQSDAAIVREIAAEEFQGEPLDLVIDDASHIFSPTRSSFESLFPLLRPGGVYVIEDWATQHQIEKAMSSEINASPQARQHVEEQLRKRADHWTELKEPLTRLLFQVILASAYTDIVDDVRIRNGTAMIRRGHEALGGDQFKIADHYMDLGRELLGEHLER